MWSELRHSRGSTSKDDVFRHGLRIRRWFDPWWQFDKQNSVDGTTGGCFTAGQDANFDGRGLRKWKAMVESNLMQASSKDECREGEQPQNWSISSVSRRMNYESIVESFNTRVCFKRSATFSQMGSLWMCHSRSWQQRWPWLAAAHVSAKPAWHAIHAFGH